MVAASFIRHWHSRTIPFDSLRPLLMNPATVMSLSDGGAHCGVICDAGMPTYLLTHWVRGRRRGERIPLEAAVKCQTRDTAELYGMADRGVLAPGMIPRCFARGDNLPHFF
jgi:N-acyl-D-amino-acid deacylase